MKHIAIGLAALVASISFIPQSEAALCTPSSDALTLNTMTVVGGSGDNLLSQDYIADCYGLFTDPSNVGSIFKTGNNFGLAGEGLLNGHGGYFDPLTILNPGQLMDLSKDGLENDPGWISLLKFEHVENSNTWIGDGDNGAYFNIFNPFTSATLNVGSVLSFDFECTTFNSDMECLGLDWTLTTTPDIVSVVQDFFKDRSTFDMLTFVFKVGNHWAAYNLDFNMIFMNEALMHENFIDDPFETAFAFSGNYTTTDFPNPANKAYQAISHFGVFARDPILTSSSTPIPAPGTLAILGSGLLMLRLFRR